MPTAIAISSAASALALNVKELEEVDILEKVGLEEVRLITCMRGVGSPI